MIEYEVKALGPDTWDAFARLAERHKGVWGGCWCIWFHPDCSEKKQSAEGNRALKERLVNEGRAHAALLFDGAVAVGWCEYGTPDELPTMYHRKEYGAGLVELPDYRLTCFFVDKAYRRKGVSAAALRGALSLIAEAGGGVVEGYPQDTDGKRISASFLYNGIRSLSEQAGFEYERPKGKNHCAGGMSVGELQHTIDDLADTDLDTLTDADLGTELVALLRLRHRLDAEISRRAACWERRSVWRGDGSRAPWARLARSAHLASGTAKGILRRGHAAATMPVTAEAWAGGEIGADHVDLLAAAASGRDELFARDEAVLVDNCDTLTFGQAVKALRYWCFRADAELDRDGTPPPAPSTLRLATSFDGAVTGDFHAAPDRPGHRHRSAPADRTRAVPRRPARRRHPHPRRADGRRVGGDGRALPDRPEQGAATAAVGMHPRRRSHHRTPLRTLHRHRHRPPT